MSHALRCPVCGGERPARSPDGLCPRCLLQNALRDGDDEGPEGFESSAAPGFSAATVAIGAGDGAATLAGLAATIGPLPRVLLRDTEPVTGPGPMIRPGSSEMPAPGDRFARLQLLGEVARGGMGAILKGRDTDLGRDLAVKILLEQHREKPELIRRFVEEAQIAGQLQHPGVVPVYELGALADRRPYFAMKLVKGRTLATLLDDRNDAAEDRPRLLGIFEQVCQTMAYAHTRGVIHRDLKPSNIMVGSFGEVQVMDWGLAKVLPQGGVADDQTAGRVVHETVIQTGRARAGGGSGGGAGSGADSDASQSGSIMGTPAYMPPEQACGEVERLDERADVFALGSILCEILTGQPAFTGRTSGEIQRKAARGDMADALGRLEACVADAELIALARDCLAPEPEDRPREARMLTERMSAYFAGVQQRLHDAELARVEAQARAEEESKRRVLADALAREAQAHAVEERRRRRLQVGLAATVLALTTVGGLGSTAYLHQWQARAAQVDLALNEAILLRDQARKEVDDLGRWQASREALKRVDVALGDEGDARARRRLDDLRREVEDGAAAARRDHELLETLADIRGSQADMSAPEVDAAYAEAFRRAGVDVDALPPADAAARLRGRPAGLVLQLAGYLDSWHSIRRQDHQPPERWRRPLAVARAADPDPYRERVRTLAEREDLKGQSDALKALARDEHAAELSPSSAMLLAHTLRHAGDAPGAIAVLERAVQQHPDDVWVNYSLASSLGATRREEALRYYTAARALRPETAHDMAHLLDRMNRSDEAIAVFRALIKLRPTKVRNLVCFGSTLRGRDQAKEGWEVTDRAIARAREAIARKPADPENQHDLGLALGSRGDRDAAIAAFREAIRIAPSNTDYLGHLGSLLESKGDYAGALVPYREVLRLAPYSIRGHSDLSRVLSRSGDGTAAIEAMREAIRLQPDVAATHHNFGHLLSDQNHPDDSLAEFREAVRLQPDDSENHYCLGRTLRKQGHYADALASLKRAHELGSKQPGWNSATATEIIRQTEVAVALESKLPALIKGEIRPADAAERMALATLCYEKGLHAAAARFRAEAFAADPKLAEDPKLAYRYSAASSAALAGSGKSRDEPPPDGAARADLRRQALEWLKAELAHQTTQLGSGTQQDRYDVRRRLDRWKVDPDLVGIRDAAELARLPEAERSDWQALWTEVDALLGKTQSPKS
jgi:serine/threonine-protein kinase